MNIVDWCIENDVWYLPIDLEIPEVLVEEAIRVYEEGFFVPHRYGDGDGWYSCAIHGFVSEDEPDTSLAWRHTKNPSGHGLTEDNVKWGWSEVAEVAPEMKRWLEEFPHDRYRRCRYMLLESGGSIETHHDASDKRIAEGRLRNISSAINLALYQPKECHFIRSDTREELPFENCTGFWFDNGVMHEVHNESDEGRFHFIIHGGSNKARKELMMKSLVKRYGKDVLREIDE